MTKTGQFEDITEEDCKVLEEGMTKCSNVLHDQAPAVGAQFPDATELETDIKALEDWVKAIRDRRK
jgi:hypothetical protein